MVIGIDFDGTCVTHNFPEMGADIGAVPILKRLVNNGHKLVLFTMRSNMISPIGDLGDGIYPDFKGNYLNEAIKWFNDNEIPLWGIQTNPNQKRWTESPKAYCNLYIDDAGLGAPLIYDKKISDRPFMDWKKVEEYLTERKII